MPDPNLVTEVAALTQEDFDEITSVMEEEKVAAMDEIRQGHGYTTVRQVVASNGRSFQVITQTPFDNNVSEFIQKLKIEDI